MTIVVTITWHSLYIEDGLVVLWHGASDAMLLKLSVVLDGCSWLFNGPSFAFHGNQVPLITRLKVLKLSSDPE